MSQGTCLGPHSKCTSLVPIWVSAAQPWTLSFTSCLTWLCVGSPVTDSRDPSSPVPLWKTLIIRRLLLRFIQSLPSSTFHLLVLALPCGALLNKCAPPKRTFLRMRTVTSLPQAFCAPDCIRWSEFFLL